MDKPIYTVLIVDDSSFVRTILRQSLEVIETCTFQIEEAEDGQKGLEHLQQIQADMLITDLEMPVMGGLELIEKVRALPQCHDLPILLLTANTDEKSKMAAFDLGATDYLNKPCLPPELRARCLGYMERRRAFMSLETAEQKTRASYETIKLQQEQMDEELEQARETQQTLLPEFLPSIPQAKVYCKYIPMDQIGGDFYDIFSLPDNKYGLMIADVTGHGIPAALLSFMVSTAFHHFSEKPLSTDEIVRNTNGELYGKMPEYKFATMFFTIYDATAQTLTFTNAAHPQGLVLRPSSQEVFELDAEGRFLGMFPNEMTLYEQKTFQLLPGDKVLLYTDAISEAANAEGTMLAISGMKEYLLNHSTQSIDILLDGLYEHGLQFSGKKRFDDDTTFLGLEVLD